MDLELVRLAVPTLAKGVWLTALLTIASVAIGFNLGLALAVMRLSKNRLMSGFAKGYSTVFRGTPLLVQLFLFYYGLGQLAFVRDNPVLWWIVGDGVRCAVLALALNTAAYTSEILRGGLMSIPGGLMEAAQACGMSRFLCFRRIAFPLAIRQALPAYGNELVLVVKGTSLASTITVLEITGHAKRLMSQTYAILEIFAIAGMLYLLINLILITLVRLLEASLTRYLPR
ncbi:ABC transporter permease [Shinella zoogloeoides]